jgi:type IV pilus assembly protein PilO
MALSDIKDVDFNDVPSWPLWLKITGTIVICIGILFAGYWFIVKGQIEGLEKAEAQERKLRQTFMQKKALAINLEAYRQQMTEMQERFGVMLKQLPNKTEVPELLIDITQAGLGRGLQFVLFQPQKRRVADFYAELPINIKVNGTYHQLGEFVSDLAALPRIVTIGDIQLAPIKGSPRLQMTATTKTYHYLDEDQIQQRKKAKQANKSQRRRRK